MFLSKSKIKNDLHEKEFNQVLKILAINTKENAVKIKVSITCPVMLSPNRDLNLDSAQ